MKPESRYFLKGKDTSVPFIQQWPKAWVALSLPWRFWTGLDCLQVEAFRMRSIISRVFLTPEIPLCQSQPCPGVVWLIHSHLISPTLPLLLHVKPSNLNRISSPFPFSFLNPSARPTVSQELVHHFSSCPLHARCCPKRREGRRYQTRPGGTTMTSITSTEDIKNRAKG